MVPPDAEDAAHAFLEGRDYELTLRITDSWGNWTYATRPVAIFRPRRASRAPASPSVDGRLSPGRRRVATRRRTPGRRC